MWAKIVVVLACVMAVGAHATPNPSLSPKQYLDRGLPAADRPWSSDDYATALRVFRQMDIAKLPSASDPDSSPVFARLVDRENLELYTDPTLPFAPRLAKSVELMQSVGEILKLYLAATMKDAARADDVIRIEGFTVQVASAMVSLGDELVPMMDPTAPNYAKQQEGLEQMKRGLAQIVHGSIMTLALKDKSAPEPSRAILARILGEEYPRMAHFLPPLSRTEFDAQLHRLASEDANPDVRAGLAAFAAAP